MCLIEHKPKQLNTKNRRSAIREYSLHKVNKNLLRANEVSNWGISKVQIYKL